MIASTWGMIIAPATPWASRARMSVAGLGASPQAAELAVNSASPSM